MADSALRLVVGLGNPGPQYQQTRHNAGFWFVEELAARHGGQFRHEAKFAGDTARIQVGGHDVWLLKPQTFMNRSGQSALRFCGFYKIPPASVLVVHDELDLAPGVVRLKRGGGPGGHNGLKDLIRHLSDNGFLRLRLGVGHPGSSRAVVDYVLTRAPADEQRLIEDGIVDAAREFPRLLDGELEKVMHALHSRRVPSPASADSGASRP